MLHVSQFRALRRSAPAPVRLLARALSSSGVSQDELLRALDKFQKESASKTVPWFLENMPPAYFRSIHEEDRVQHLNAITALVGAEQPEILLRSPDARVFSHFRSGANFPGRLANVLEQLPLTVDDATLARVKIFTALDDSLGLDIFRFGQQEPFLNKTEDEKIARASIQRFCADIQAGKHAGDACYPQPGPHFEPEAVDTFLTHSTTMYVQFSNPRRLAWQMQLFSKVRGTEGVAVDVEHKWETRSDENKLASSGIPQTMLTIAAPNVIPKSFMQKAATYLGLCNLNVVRAHLDVVQDPQNKGHVAMIRILVQPSEEALKEKFQFEWSKISGNLKYLKWVDDRPVHLTLQHPDLGISRAELIYAYGNMLHGVLAKKDPFAYSLTRIMETLEHAQHLPLTSRIADFFLDKFDPSNDRQMTDAEQDAIVDELKKEIRRNVEQEDAILLLNSMADAVRGTLRTNKFIRDRYALSLRMDPKVMGYGTVGKDTPYGVFFIYGRRFKGFHVRFRDIARGGLRMVYPGSTDAHALESARQYNEAYNLAFAQQLKNKDIPEGGSKAVVLCDPIVGPIGDVAPRDFILRKSVKSFSDALLDLNTTDVAVKAKIVDYYGKDELIYLGPDENIIPEDIVWMTSGLRTVATRSRNIDPSKQPFTVKITGGTDGDVAGNVIKILHREYGNNLRIVGICDGTGGVRARNSMHNRVKSDLFIPAGGRPNTINENNWRDYIDADGKPSSGLIDSSANKCGVVCSSYEIVASMLLETDEFLAVKDELVVEVVDKLRALARVEAQLLFREYKKDPTSALPPASERISRAITRVHDAVLAHFDDVCEEDQQILFTLIEEHLPPKLRELALDRVQQNVPLAYLRSIVASSLASKIVYREGLQFTEALPDSNLGNMALQYLKQEKKVQRLVQDLRSSQLTNKDDIADLLVRGGVRAGLDTPN
ncbi:NAD-specific glutamate dehydrogenase [Phytophthora ramorum]|uniref:NAD-specific glutamate dehydrogenase n=1 Tax=Phytophthora ramorum TaxID=164328 RepID=UPI0030A4AC18|nr:NAD-specific glutamate dehydrogenase [Phytophthora ramorum]